MPAFYAGKRVGKPLLNGHTYNALFNGKLVWPLDKDTVVSIEITDDKGKPLPKSLVVSGTLKLGAKATYADGHVGDLLTTKNVTFTSRDTSTATVSGNTLTWRHGGTILVTATVNGFTSAAASIASAYAPESIKVTDDSGKPIDNITLRVGESKNLKVTILPDAASQEFAASAARPDIAVVGDAKPTGITVSPESLTLRGGRNRQPERQHPAGLRAAGVYGIHQGCESRISQTTVRGNIMPTTTAFRGGASVRALKEGDTSITITAGSIVKTIPVSVWGNKWVLPTLPATRNGITFTAAGDGMVHAKGTATDWATILVTQDLPAGEYTLEHTLADGVGPFCELKSTDGRIDLFSHGTVKATLPAGDYQMLVTVSPGKTVDATITPILRKLN